MSSTTVTWWTPGGFDRYTPPIAYIHAMSALEANGAEVGYFGTLRAHGYEFVDTEGDYEDHELKLNVAINRGTELARPSHVFVEIVSIEITLSRFFVDEVYVDAFFATKYLELRKDIGAVSANAAQNDMRRFLLAFIRHGHGAETVDANGWQTLDERIAAQRQAQQSRRQRDAEKAAAIPPPH